jgi:hypothetical protein
MCVGSAVLCDAATTDDVKNYDALQMHPMTRHLKTLFGMLQSAEESG